MDALYRPIWTVRSLPFQIKTLYEAYHADFFMKHITLNFATICCKITQIPSSFFFQLLDTGVITRLRTEEDPSVSPEVDRLMDRATPNDQRQATARFEKVIAYLNGEKERYGGVPPRTLHRWVVRFREAEE